MSTWEVKQYAGLINKILHKGEKRQTRNKETYAVFGETITIDLQEGFPLLVGRKLFYKGVFGELAAMLRGPKHITDFSKYGCNYWDAFGDKTLAGAADAVTCSDEDFKKHGALRLDYGNAWINFNGVNQIEQLIEKIRNNPTDRRLLISGWRPDHLADLSLPCCHLLYQWYVRDKKYLDMVWYQRSADTMVGIPSDIILCSLWNTIIANECGYEPGVIKLIFGDTHIYSNHVEPALDYMRQLNTKINCGVPITKCVGKLDTKATCKNFLPDMMELSGYDPMPAIKFELNV